MITDVIKLGNKGDGTVIVDGAEYFVPYVIDGEQVEIEIDNNGGNHARLKKIVVPSKKRIAPLCPLFGVCGACKLQHLGNYEEFKTASFLKTIAPVINDAVDVMPMNFIIGNVRRRALLKVDNGAVGFFKEKSNTVVPVSYCPLLKDAINAFIKDLRLPPITADLTVTLTTNGLDVDIKGKQTIPPVMHKTLARECRKAIRLTVDGVTVSEKEKPYMIFGKTAVRFPVGSFLQPSEEGEKTLLGIVKKLLPADGKRIADIFCGMGTFTFPLAEAAKEVIGFEAATFGVRAVNTAKCNNVRAYERDLFKNPLTAAELDRFDAVLMDPPRDGAIAQSRMLKKTAKIKQIVYISCNPATFTRDAKEIIVGGFALKTVAPVDQFRYTPHTELVADFRRI